MAVDDIIIDVDDVDATVDFQPAAGVEVVITGIGHEASALVTEILYRLIDGSLLSATAYMNNTVIMLDQAHTNLLKLGITNTVFLRRQNQDAADRNMSFTGIQTK